MPETLGERIKARRDRIVSLAQDAAEAKAAEVVSAPAATEALHDVVRTAVQDAVRDIVVPQITEAITAVKDESQAYVDSQITQLAADNSLQVVDVAADPVVKRL